ncbi:hypothetical protein D081_0668 [Anaerovibrio sp. JC8]|uniref:hypothetical protein n=1 Tax=Anaerovibrio sp. JC8 TaxID=1240085 RepID=UPI000A09E275|nr:hypothetical protein [Anaerovibrio sp. JC8]ORU00686.1 hypothetical protein D081_0668 [Anaerovibrio sp. JC8]
MEKLYRLLITQIFVTVIMFAAVSLNASQCQAAHWEQVASSSDIIVQIDASTVDWVEYPDLGRNIVCSYKFIETDKSYIIRHCAFREIGGKPEYAIFEYTTFDGADNQREHKGNSTPTSDDYKPIIPGSDGELFYEIAKMYVRK